MTRRLALLGAASGLALATFAPATTAHADCAPVVNVVCAVVCWVPNDAVHRICYVL